MTGITIGHGIDAHRLMEGRRLMLGGVHVPYESGLLGHSDGDCVAHALADALLSAAGLGDIGRHFPSSDERWKDVAGLALLDEVRRLIAPRTVMSASVVIVAEAPRLHTFIGAMESGIADALHLGPGVVRVSATSTDGMGFRGRGEGISASAVALVYAGE
jgi:2-C-methyl-D-erythritol 2,4-cyclodiphosphate synthase